MKRMNRFDSLEGSDVMTTSTTAHAGFDRRGKRVQIVAATALCLALAPGAALAQQTGQIAFTLGTLDFSEVRLRLPDGSDHAVSPQIQVNVGGTTVAASVASLGNPVWSKNRRQIVANALLAPTSSIGFNQLLMNNFSTPSKILVVFDPATGQGNAVFDMSSHNNAVSPYVIDAAFSADGNRLVYSYLQTNFVQYGIVNRDGTGNVPLFSANLTEQALGTGVDWSPRTDQLGNFGNLLVVSYPLPVSSCIGTPATAAGLVLVKLGSPVTYQILTRPPGPCGWDFSSMHDRSPVFSPDGTRVAFVRAVQDSNAIVTGSAIMTIDRNGAFGSENLVKYVPGVMIQHVSWSQDGAQVMFDATAVGFAGLTSPLGVWTLTMPTSGSGVLSQVSALGQQAFMPAWGSAQ
jgi:WD40 repeat protein